MTGLVPEGCKMYVNKGVLEDASEIAIWMGIRRQLTYATFSFLETYGFLPEIMLHCVMI